jgi:hypothetical protein
MTEEWCESDKIGLEGLENCMPTWCFFRGLRAKLVWLYFLGKWWAKGEGERRLWEVTGQENDFLRDKLAGLLN